MGMIWLLLVLFLGWVGLPWFAALGLVLLLFAAVSGMDSLLVMLEFSTLRGMEQLLAIPLLLAAARLLMPASERPAPEHSVPSAFESASGLWLLQQGGDRERGGNPAWSLMPGVSLLAVWLLISALSPARAPALQTLFLAGLLPVILTWCLFAVPRRAVTDSAQAPATGTSGVNAIQWTASVAALLLLGGLYFGRWSLMDASALLVVLIGTLQLGCGQLTIRALWLRILTAIRDFGQLALLLGLGLAWIVLVFDNGLDRNWLQPLATLLPAGLGLLLPGIWLSLVWLLAAWKLQPLVALIIGAPWLLPSALQLDMPSAVVILLTVISLQVGHRLKIQARLSARQLGGELMRLLLVVLALLSVPGLAGWLPGLFT